MEVRTSRSGSGGGPLIAANVIVTGRNPEYLSRAALDLGAVRTAAFDATDPAALQRFFGDLPDPVDHVMVTAGSQYYARLADVAALAVHLMTNTALAGATYDIDGGAGIIAFIAAFAGLIGMWFAARRSVPPWCRERSSRPVLAFKLAPPHDRQIMSPVVRCATP